MRARWWVPGADAQRPREGLRGAASSRRVRMSGYHKAGPQAHTHQESVFETARGPRRHMRTPARHRAQRGSAARARHLRPEGRRCTHTYAYANVRFGAGRSVSGAKSAPRAIADSWPAHPLRRASAPSVRSAGHSSAGLTLDQASLHSIAADRALQRYHCPHRTRAHLTVWFGCGAAAVRWGAHPMPPRRRLTHPNMARLVALAAPRARLAHRRHT